MKKVAILQSNYIPWKGYFDLVASVDEFIIYDEMQYTRRDWRNRNLIKTSQGPQWLTVPVRVKGKYHQKICETEIEGTDWSSAHWKALQLNYRRAEYFNEVMSWLEPIYNQEHFLLLSDLNRRLIVAICNYLNVSTAVTSCSEYHLAEGKTERLVDLCLQSGGGEYVSGPSARDYIDPAVFASRQVKLTWFDYNGYPEYPQLWGDFVHSVSILDLLFNCGPNAHRYMKFVRP